MEGNFGIHNFFKLKVGESVFCFVFFFYIWGQKLRSKERAKCERDNLTT